MKCPLVLLTLLLLLFPLTISTGKAAQSKSPLTEEQIDIYVVFFNKFLSEHKVFAVLAEKTEPLTLSADDWKDACMSGIELPKTRQTKVSTHSLGTKFIARIKPRLLQSSRLQAYVSPPDQEKPTKEASKEGLLYGSLQVSEVVFDKTHRFAVMRYWFACGALCGEGRLLVFMYDGDHWKEKTDVLCGLRVS